MKVIFPVKIYQKLRAYVNNIEYEISGLGKVRRDGADFIIEDIKIFKQKVTGADTQLDHQALADFYNEIIESEGDLSNWKLWWHSHADMKQFFSSIDIDTIEDFNAETKEDNWMLHLVTNHEGRILIRLDLYTPVRCTIDNLAYQVDFNDPELNETVSAEIAEKVTTPDLSKPKIDFSRLFPDKPIN